jgi:hypothetical protein
MPLLTAVTPKPCLNPFGDAWGPSGMPAALVSADILRHAVIRLQVQRRTDSVNHIQGIEQLWRDSYFSASAPGSSQLIKGANGGKM